MQARRTDGTTIDLAKDCECVTHDGPHWLDVDRRWREANQRMLDAGNVAGWSACEGERIREKLWQMTNQRIEQVLA